MSSPPISQVLQRPGAAYDTRVGAAGGIQRPGAPASARGASGAKAASSEPADTLELSAEARQELQRLRQVDAGVRQHEAAHLAAGAGVARGPASYSYRHGPDGQLYAVGGEVQVDSPQVSGNPEATIQKALQVQRAALAPAEPSSTDLQVASAAQAAAANASAELAAQHNEGQTGAAGAQKPPAPGTLVNLMV